jgi:hypothetical protein
VGSAGVQLRSSQNSDRLSMSVKRNYAFEIRDGGSYGMDGGLEGFFSFAMGD